MHHILILHYLLLSCVFLRLFLSIVSIFRLYCAFLPNLCWYSEVSHDGSSYTKDIGKGYKSTPSSLFFGRTGCYTFTSTTPLNTVSKEISSGVSRGEIKT